MPQTETAMRTAGAWLAIASLLLIGTLIFHGPVHPDMAHQMKVVSEGATRWAIVHWVAAGSLSAFAMAGLLMLAARSRLTQDWWSMSAWALLPVGALWTVSTAVAEATVIADAAAAGHFAVFEAWWAFAEGKANGFAFLALAVAVIAGNEARSGYWATPVWASWVAVVAGIGAFAGWVLGMWIGIGFGSLVWLVSSVVMCLWTTWFGLRLARAEIDLPARTISKANV